MTLGFPPDDLSRGHDLATSMAQRRERGHVGRLIREKRFDVPDEVSSDAPHLHHRDRLGIHLRPLDGAGKSTLEFGHIYGVHALSLCGVLTMSV